MMKRITIIIFALFLSISAFAQEEEREYLNGMVPVAAYPEAAEVQFSDSLHLPLVDDLGRVPAYRTWFHPYYGGWNSWQLHEGMNVSVGLSAFTQFRSGGYNGIAERISAMYAKPITKSLSFSIGGFMNNVSTNYGVFREGGITAMLDYRINDHWDAFVYGQKSFVQNNTSLPLPFCYDLFNIGDRIGAGVCYHFNESTSLQVQFDYSRIPNFHRGIEERWKMPVQPIDKK